MTTAAVYLQILVGAAVRHTEAGLAIPDFPFAFGGLLPPSWSAAIAIHFAHRVGAVLVIGGIMATALHVWWHHRDRRELMRPAVLLVVLAIGQATLGAFVVWTGLQPVVNTAHVVNGSLVLATSLVLTLRAFGPRFTKEPAEQTEFRFVGPAGSVGSVVSNPEARS